jgi:hypothetical protein
MSAELTHGASSRCWRLEGEHALVHPTGWTTARYALKDTWIYFLWHGDEKQGQFASTQAAKQKHATLTGWTSEPSLITSAATPGDTL